MKKTESKKQQLFNVLKNGGYWTVNELSKEIDVAPLQVRELIRQLRKGFLENGTVDNYIYTTKFGYTIDEKPENVMYEARLRMALGVGTLINGIWVFKKSKSIAHKQFRDLNISYKPKMLTVQNLIK